MPPADLWMPIVESIRQDTGLPVEAVEAQLEGWTALPLEVAGEHVGTFIQRGTEVHFALRPGHRPRFSYRGPVRRLFAPLLDQYGYLTTRIPKTHPEQAHFVTRIGFAPTWSDATFDYFLLDTLPFERTPR